MYISDIEFTEARDKVQDNREVIEMISQKHHWSYLGETGQRITNALSGVSYDNEWKCFLTWDKYLENKLQFPFKAKVVHTENNWLIKEGDILNFQSI